MKIDEHEKQEHPDRMKINEAEKVPVNGKDNQRMNWTCFFL